MRDQIRKGLAIQESQERELPSAAAARRVHLYNQGKPPQVGEYHDFYMPNGDKAYGQVTHTDGKSVTFKHSSGRHKMTLQPER